jgi:antirestriction protein
MKKTKYSAIVLLSALAISACSDDEAVKAVEKSPTTQTSSTSTGADEFMIFDFEKTAKDQELQILINETIDEYKAIIKDVRAQSSSNRADIESQILENIGELKQAYAEQVALHEKNCTSINEANVDSCNKIGAGNIELKNKYLGLEVELQNKLKEIKAKEITMLRKYQADMKNNIKDLLSKDI